MKKTMMMTKIYLLSKSIHRILLLIILFIGVLMSMTGILLKYTFLASKFNFIDLGQVRYIHNNLSPAFSIVFFMMALTGIIMYIFPLTRNK
jgi:H+/Cl- antiporter ClcA